MRTRTENEENAGSLRILCRCSKHIYFYGKEVLGENRK
jgi:hypothetical protein